MDNLIQAVFVGSLIGIICGIAPLIVSIRKSRDGLAVASMVTCFVCGALGGAILAIPVSLAFFAVAITGNSNKG